MVAQQWGLRNQLAQRCSAADPEAPAEDTTTVQYVTDATRQDLRIQPTRRRHAVDAGDLEVQPNDIHPQFKHGSRACVLPRSTQLPPAVHVAAPPRLASLRGAEMTIGKAFANERGADPQDRHR